MNIALPAALLSAAAGLALGFAPRRARTWSLALLLVAALASALTRTPPGWAQALLVAAAVSTAACAAAVHLPHGVGPRLAAALALNSGFWIGLLTATERGLLTIALPWALLAAPAAWLVSGGRGVVVKVGAGWLIAVALLAAALPLVSTPGYAPDHID
jgi:hypothetical protein